MKHKQILNVESNEAPQTKAGPSAAYGGGNVTTTFCILGTKIDSSNLEPIIDTFYANFWDVLPAFRQESFGGTHFNRNGTNRLNTVTPFGYPLSDGALGWGYGISQVSNEVGSADQLWNWQSNIEIGMSFFAIAANYADSF